MDFVNKLSSGLGGQGQEQGQQGSGAGVDLNAISGEAKQQGGFGGGLLNKLHGAVGGGPDSERNEDALDKAIDMAQEKFLGAGPQNNENAIEQAKDEQISDFIRSQYKGMTGKELPVADKS